MKSISSIYGLKEQPIVPKNGCYGNLNNSMFVEKKTSLTNPVSGKATNLQSNKQTNRSSRNAWQMTIQDNHAK
jgi:hypothetical protein